VLTQRFLDTNYTVVACANAPTSFFAFLLQGDSDHATSDEANARKKHQKPIIV
jgi:hypothetical protein